MFRAVLTRLDGLPKTWVMVFALLLTAVLGCVNFLLGYEISFAVFYLFPVSMAAWRSGMLTGAVLSIGSALTWHIANILSGQEWSHPLTPFWNMLTRLGFFLVVTMLLAELKKIMEEEKALARTEPLTGALNGRAFLELVFHELARSGRNGCPISVIYLDLDNFKTVNDTLGHSVGNKLLIEVVRIFRGGVRPTDSVARLGGDEFCLLLPETDGRQAANAVERIRNSVAAEMARNQWPVTLSVGVLTCQKPFPTADEMLRMVDGLMYQAKKEGKNRIVFGEHTG